MKNDRNSMLDYVKKYFDKKRISKEDKDMILRTEEVFGYGRK